MKILDTNALRSKYAEYWRDDEIDVDLANEIVDWSAQASYRIDDLETECDMLGRYANFLKVSLRSGEFHAANVEFVDFCKKYKDSIMNSKEVSVEEGITSNE